MNINYKESQIDFLSHVEGKAAEPAHPRYMAARISLSLENLVIFGIVAIMVVIFSFSLGIERGKGVAFTAPASDDPGVKGRVSASHVTGKEREEHEQRTEPVSSRKVVAMAEKAGLDHAVSKARPADKGAYTLQVASYKGLKSAQREADNLKKKGFDDVYVLPKGTYMIVCVGNFQNKEDASDVKRQLKSRYQGSVVRRL